MTKPSYLAVILVLASKGELYDKFRQYWAQYDSLFPEIKVHYVYGDSNTTPQVGDLVYDIPETYWPGMITKSIMAMEQIQDIYDYQYLVRTNLSTFWDIEQLIKRLYNYLGRNVVAGTIRSCTHNGLYYNEYLSGTNQVYSSDIVSRIISAKDKLISLDLPEDLVVSNYCLKELNLSRCSGGAIQVIENQPLLDEVKFEILYAKYRGIDNYRVKTKDRALDLEVFRILLKLIYNRELNEASN